MENQNGTFTPLRLKPLAGAYFTLSGSPFSSVSSGFAGGALPALPKEAQFAVIDDVTGGLRFVDSQPTEPLTEYVVLVNDQVIRHGVTEGGVKEKALQRLQANVLLEQLKSTGSFEAELTIYHRLALFVVLERMVKDIVGGAAGEEPALNLSRENLRMPLVLFLETLPPGITFLEGVKRYLEGKDPLRKIHTLNELMPLLD